MSISAYFGGKSSKQFQNFINPNINKDGIKTYIEVFGGSMATFLDDKNLSFEKVIYNDKNLHQANFMSCCSHPEEFLKHIYNFKKKFLNCNETEESKIWNFYKPIYKEIVSSNFLDDLNFEIGNFEKAATYAFLITSAHNGIYPKSAGFNGYKKNHKKLKLDILIKKLETNKYTQKFKSISNFLSLDFEEVIKSYDSEDTYLYLDPPYYKYEDGKDNAERLFWYGSDKDNMFGPESHRRLLNLLPNLKSRWSLSYYYFPLLEKLLPTDKYIWKEKLFKRCSAQGGNNYKTKTKPELGSEILILSDSTFYTDHN